MSSSHEKSIGEFISKINSRRSMYGSVLVTGYFRKVDSRLVNISLKVVPLCFSEVAPVSKKLDYGDSLLVRTTISLDDLITLVKGLPFNAMTDVQIADFTVEVAGGSFGDSYKFDSADEPLDIGWYFERYLYANRSPNLSNTALMCPDLPFFPSFREALKDFVGIDIDHYSDAFGIIFCLPNYSVRISQVSFSSTQMRVSIETKTMGATDIVGKIYCRSGKQVKQEDVFFSDTDKSSTIGLAFKPQYFYVTLLSKISGEVLDQRFFYFGWESLPKGVEITIPEYDLLALIKGGETETVELKKTIDKPTEFAETVVSFANLEGGVIILGVDDKANIVGLETDLRDTVTHIISSHCEPSVEYSTEDHTLNEKKLLLVKVEQGKDKPYMVRERGVYVRANATDRIATRFEMDEFYRQKSTGFGAPLQGN